ncbi:hypothetical protein [Pinibacter aurantiacus]|uniref:Uncharacterized protein n=1 Tax=Pinibacter aurantiacus TaxID=2851599 RepID=A0A9E2S9G2_9BACT|nr:hypothetical protein [Pinibacter aurantiacus]MBV4358032.1 hypothetical protein [Pinibacter aurantiacus]
MMKKKIDLSHINSLEDLAKEQHAVKARIRMREDELKTHFKQIPKEALKFGAAAIVPSVLQSKAASSAFAVGKNILGGLFAKKGEKGEAIWTAVRQAGLYVVIKQALKIFAKKF